MTDLMPSLADDFCFGPRKMAATGANCCGKPVGCTNTNPGCLYLRHPWKRAYVKALRERTDRATRGPMSGPTVRVLR